MLANWAGTLLIGLALLGSGPLLTGCSSPPKIDWDARVGHYTRDQAVEELGPPASSATLSNGNVVADWLTKRLPQSGFSVGTGFYGGPVGVGVGQNISTAPRAQYLRLTFNADGQLLRWERVTY
jgi:hypothetical protein